MNRNSLTLVLAFAGALLALVLWMMRAPVPGELPNTDPAPGSSAPVAPMAESPPPPAPAAAPAMARAAPDAPSPRPTPPTPEPLTMLPQDQTPFLASDLAAQWKRELGYTDEDFVRAQRAMRAEGLTDPVLNDPGVVLRRLPSRHVGSVAIASIDLPRPIPSGQPIPIRITGTAPSPSFQFTHLDTLVQGEVIRIQARGHADGETEAGLGGPLVIDETLPPLPPGNYRIEIPSLGPRGSFPFTVPPEPDA